MTRADNNQVLCSRSKLKPIELNCFVKIIPKNILANDQINLLWLIDVKTFIIQSN